MKKWLIALLVIVLAAVGGWLLLRGGGAPVDTSKADYDTIATVKREMERVSKSSAMSSYSNQGQWYVYDMRLMYQNDEALFKKLREDLGEDFDSVLSNGDPIFIGVMPLYKSYRVYAGNPDDAHMLYPDWNYERLAAPQ